MATEPRPRSRWNPGRIIDRAMLAHDRLSRYHGSALMVTMAMALGGCVGVALGWPLWAGCLAGFVPSYLVGAAYWLGRAISEAPSEIRIVGSEVETIDPSPVALSPEVVIYLDGLARSLGVTPEQAVIMGAIFLTRAEQARRLAGSVETLDVPAILTDRGGRRWPLQTP